MDEQRIPDNHDGDDVEAHGLKETVAAAAAVGALALPAAAQAYIPSPDGSGERIVVATPKAKQATKKAGKTKAAKKKTAKASASSAGKTSPKKGPLMPE